MAKQVKSQASVATPAVADVVSTPAVKATKASKAGLTSDNVTAAARPNMIPTPAVKYDPKGAKVQGVDGLVKPGMTFRIKPSDLLVEPGYNVRDFNPEVDADDAELLASINAIGIVTDLEVRLEGNRAFIVRGHRRYAAVMHHNAREGATQIVRIPARLAAEMNAADRTLDVLTSNNGKPLTPTQRGVAALKLRTFGWTDAEISTASGINPRTLADCFKLAQADASIRKIVKGYVDQNRVNEDTGKPLVVKASDTTVSKVLATTGPDAPAVLQKAAEIVPTKGAGAGKITDAVTSKAAAIVATEKGAPLLTAKGKQSKGGKSPAAKGNAAAAGKEAPKQAARPVAAAQLTVDMATLTGPFRVLQDGTILDMGGNAIAEASDVAHAKAIVGLMNEGEAARNKAAKAAPSGPTPASAKPGKAKPDATGQGQPATPAARTRMKPGMDQTSA